MLDERYARGEITRAAYLQARTDLGGKAPAESEATTEVTPPSAAAGARRRRRADLVDRTQPGPGQHDREHDRVQPGPGGDQRRRDRRGAETAAAKASPTGISPNEPK